MNDYLIIKDLKNAAQEITDYFVTSKDILICAGMVYKKKSRFYCPIGTDEQLIRRIYSIINRDQISQISTRLVKEAANRIMHHPTLHYDFEAERKRDELKLNLKNGVHVISSKTFTEEDRNSHFDYMLDFNYRRNVSIEQAKVFVKFVESSLGREYLLCILLIMAYLISSLTQGRKAFLLLGKGATGKSTFLELIEAIVGDSFFARDTRRKARP